MGQQPTSAAGAAAMAQGEAAEEQAITSGMEAAINEEMLMDESLAMAEMEAFEEGEE